jgi:hypothetical protein
MVTVEIPVDRPRPRLLTFDCEYSSMGFTVPRFTRPNLAKLIYWLWEFDPEAGPELGGSTEPYLLDDAYLLLQGGVFSVAYPTDYGKSTLVDLDTVASLLFWPEDTLNLVVKRSREAACKAAQGIAFKLLRASEHFPYARPLCRWDSRTTMPMVNDGYFIAGCRLRELGERNRSVYPAGIGQRANQGMRGRTKLDDLEDENTLKSDAATDTLHKQVNNAVRGLEGDVDNALWAIFGTPQGANSVMHVVDRDLARMGSKFRIIRRPRIIQDGPNKGKLLFPKREIKYEMQRGIMDPGALQIAYGLVEPGAGTYDPLIALKTIPDERFSLPANENQFREYLYQRLVQSAQGGQYDQNRAVSEASRMVTEELVIYGGWDPATVGTYAISLMAMLPKSRWVLRFEMNSTTSDEQAERLLEWQAFFPSVYFVVERDGTQDAFIDIMRLKDPNAMVLPHTTHGYNKHTRHSGIPAMMREMSQPGVWHLPWVPEDHCVTYFELLLNEIRRWSPTAHPHGIPSLWFSWYYDKQTRIVESRDDARGSDLDVSVSDVVLFPASQGLRDPLRGPRPPEPEPRWRRWPTVR